jgi:hypothetical protein
MNKCRMVDVTRKCAVLENYHQAHTWNNRCARNTSCGANDLEITCQPQPWHNVKVVKHFQLVLDARAASSLSQQIEVVLEHAAKVGVRVGESNSPLGRLLNSPLPPRPRSKNTVIGLVSLSAKDTCEKNPQPSLLPLSIMYWRNV